MVAWLAGLAATLLWPITRAGYLLGHDMVFTPRQPLDLASIGLSSASPRAVPLDALVALAERLADGALVGRLAVLAPVFAAGLGVAVLLASRSLPARLAAGSFAVWNAYFVERMALGQWALLWAYAALPWVVLAVSRGRGAGGWFARAVALAAASITPTGGLIAGTSAVTVSAVGGRSRAETLRVAVLALVLQLPWVIAAVVSAAGRDERPGRGRRVRVACRASRRRAAQPARRWRDLGRRCRAGQSRPWAGVADARRAGRGGRVRVGAGCAS